MKARRRLGAALAAASLGAALALGAPTPAAAGHGHSGKRHHGLHRGHHDFGHGYGRHRFHRPYRPYRHDRHDRHDRHHRAHHRIHHHGPSCGHDGYARRGYLCRPCGHHFASLDLLHAHVHRHHHVPFWKLPFVIVAHAAGFFVYG